MRHFDLSPLHSSTIGFDRIFSLLGERNEPAPVYPPYNIEKTGENSYRITVAVAGFEESELSIESRENSLAIRGAKRTSDEGGKGEYLFRGIAARTFERRFQLADYVTVGEATLNNGLLHVDLKRELPESVKPKQIKIGSVKPQPLKVESGEPQALAA